MGNFEVVVIDDGSPDGLAPTICAPNFPFELHMRRQPNAGPAAARHHGATIARGDVLVFLDDDMRVPPGFLAAHLEASRATPRAVVLGEIRSPRGLDQLPLFERFHARLLAHHFRELRATGRAPRGTEVCTGNLSMRRSEYLAVGGFDPTLARSEDAELGARLEKAGANLRFSAAGYSVHDSDHTDVRVWLRRAFLYGVYEQRIARKHPDLLALDPWHWLEVVTPAGKPLLVAAVVAPEAAGHVVEGVIRVAQALDRVGFERPALAGATLAYGLQYFRGVRTEEGSLRRAWQRRQAFVHATRRQRASRPGGASTMSTISALRQAVRSIRADHDMVQRYDTKYTTSARRGGSLLHDFVHRAGFQMMVGYRAMRFFSDAGIPTVAKVLSRGIRFLYGADLHPDARLADGVVIVHGMGIAISPLARVDSGCILSHNVSLSEGRDASTETTGAPHLEGDVHVGPGATVLGPVTVGAGSKVMAGALLRQSVPPGSLVETPAPNIRLRASSAARTAHTPSTAGA